MFSSPFPEKEGDDKMSKLKRSITYHFRVMSKDQGQVPFILSTL